MKLALSLNDIVRLVMEKYPGYDQKSRMTTPPEGLFDADTEILHMEILPTGSFKDPPPPPQTSMQASISP